jgi:hypothetical protein
MAIIRYTKDATIRYAYLNIFPDQFKTEKEKQDESWVKNTMDYFANKAYAEYIKNRETFVKNYDLMKGILRMEDFYQEPETKSFAEMLQADIGLPAYVKHYSILTTPINELVGEISKRPDTYRVKAFDDDSQAEELEYKTEVLQQYVISQAKQKIIEKAAMQGEEIDEDQLEQLTMEQVKESLDTYTSVAEKWGNRILTCQKADFNTKEMSEDAFRDLLISAREFYHIYEDNSKVGYNIEVANTKNTWFLTTPDRKWVSDPTGRARGAYAAGTVQVMELSEIIESAPDLTKEEIDHLRSSLQDYGLINVRESNLGNPEAIPGQDSVMYDTFDPLVLQTRMIIESEMKENSDGLKDFLGLTSNVSSFGYKYVVVRAYWISKKKIGKVVYLDEVGNEQSLLVDENYKSGIIPSQQSLEWGWINQWYQGTKIGPDIYHMKPMKLLNYCPIIGTTYEVKNTEAKSLVDLMKPFQVLYNICMNQLYRLLEKEIGNVASINIRRIPKLKDGDDNDALDVWEMEARERGIIFDDDSPENTKAPVSNTSIAKNIDLTRTNEIQARYTLAVQLKNECWELIGMSRQRLGSITASESATGTNAAIQQSYAQTEPLFVAHEYVLGQLYQAIIDASLYIESSKPTSTLSYITSEGESAFVQVNGNDLKLRDLKVFPTNRPEDTQMFNELRQLSQAVLQNGGTIYDVIELYSTKSMREMKKTFKELKDRVQAMQDQQMRQKQQEIEQTQQIAAAQMEQALSMKQQEMINQNYQNDLDRINKKELALIAAESKGATMPDVDNNGVPDVLEIGKLTNEQNKLSKEYSIKMADIQSKASQNLQKMQLEREKLQVARENMVNDLQIAKENSKNRAQKPAKK